MRDAFVETSLELMGADPDLYFLTGDLGFMFFEPIAEAYPERFINVGVAEANMIGVAGGLARSGKRVFCYSMVPFISMRCLEQVRIHLAIAKLNITLIGVGAGYGYGCQGASHHALEDIGVVAAFPNLSVFSPADGDDLRESLLAAHNKQGPSYIRIGRTVAEPLARETSDSRLGVSKIALDSLPSADGDRIILLSTGTVLPNVAEAAKLLRAEGFPVDVYSVATLKPFDGGALAQLLQGNPLLFTVELNVRNGGLGSIVATHICTDSLSVKGFCPLTLRDEYIMTAGSTQYLEAQNGLDAAGIASSVKRYIQDHGESGDDTSRVRVVHG